jgi:hypothetical protein
MKHMTKILDMTQGKPAPLIFKFALPPTLKINFRRDGNEVLCNYGNSLRDNDWRRFSKHRLWRG